MSTMTLRSVDYLKNPRGWACGNFCPVKRYERRGNDPVCGVVLDRDNTTVYECNMYTLPEALKTCPQHKYATVEELVANGWMGTNERRHPRENS